MISQKYKNTEVGVIPEDWEVKTLKDLSVLITKGTTPKRFTGAGVTYVKIESLTGDKINVEKCLFVDDITHKTDLKRSILCEGDLLFAIAGATIGKCTIVPKEIIPANTNQALAIIRLKEEENKMYVFYFLKSTLMQKYIIDNIAGGAQPNLNLAQVGGYFFPNPPTKAEQTAIATALSDADALISSLEKIIAKKRNIKQGAMQKLLQPKEGWEVKKLGDLAVFRRGSFPQPYGLDKWYDDVAGYPFIQVFDVDDNKRLKQDTKRHISKEAQPFSVFVKKGSIVLTIQGSIGRIAITQYDAFVDRTLLLFEEFKIKFDNYFFMLLIHLLFEKEKETAPGGIIKTITKAALTNFVISYPKSVEEQTRIATILLDMDNEISALETKLEKYRKVKLGMMQNLLTGKIRLV